MGRFLLCTFFLVFVAMPVMAESEPEIAPPVEGKVELSEKSEKVLEKIEDSQDQLNKKIKDMVKDFDAAQTRHFMTVYNNHNIVSAVDAVRGDIKNAVKSCRDNNKDLSELNDDLKARFKLWDKTVGDALSEGRDKIKNMIVAQDYTKNNNIRSILKRADRLRAQSSKTIEKVPISTPESCTFLLKQMDKTEERLAGLIRSTLVTLPSALEDEKDDDGEAK